MKTIEANGNAIKMDRNKAKGMMWGIAGMLDN